MHFLLLSRPKSGYSIPQVKPKPFEDSFMRRLVLSLLALILFPSLASAQKAEDIAKIENYLNNIKTLKASFVQIASNANTSEGELYIAKPNKIRMEYADPVNVTIVGDGNFIVYNDIKFFIIWIGILLCVGIYVK